MSEDKLPRLAEVRALIFGANNSSVGFVQRTFGMGYNEAARYVDRLVDDGFLSEPNSVGVRKVQCLDLKGWK